MTGQQDWTRQGFPTMLMLSGFVLIGLAAIAGYRRGINCNPLAQWKMIVLHTLLLLNAIFLGFGPGGTVRVNMMALHLYLQVAIGIFYILTGHSATQKLYFLWSFFTLFCLMGNLPILGYSSDVFAADQSSCLTYFGETGQEQADKSGAWERCKDDGYLMFIKVIGFFTILLEVIVLSITFLTITDGETGGGGSPRYSHSDGKKKNPLLDESVDAAYSSYQYVDATTPTK